MSDIKKIDTNTYVTVQGQYAVVNEGSGYAIINIQTKQVIARNITSFLDCVKTLEYILGNAEPPHSDPIQVSAVLTEPVAPPKPIKENIIHKTQELDELDLALVRGLSSYFEEMNGKIRRYHRDHDASQAEAEVIARYYLKAADIARNVKDQRDLKGLLEFIENLKEKVSRYQHKSHKYRWSTGLEKEVIAKLNRIMIHA
jgi:hypothetical protein